MEEILIFLNIILGLNSLISLFLSLSASESFKQKIKNNLIYSLVITLVAALVFYLNASINFESMNSLFEFLLIFYLLVFISVVITKFLSDWIIKLLLSSNKEILEALSAVILLVVFLGFSILGFFISSTNFGGVRVRFTEDVLAQFIDNDNVKYNVKIPKNTVVILKDDDIIQNDHLIKSGNENLKLLMRKNVILFRASKKIPLTVDKHLYLVEEEYQNPVPELLIPNNIGEIRKYYPWEKKYNLDTLNSQFSTVKFLPDTKISLTKDTDVVLQQDTKVEIYEMEYKYLVAASLCLVGILTPLNIIYIGIRGTSDKRQNKVSN